jgi:hypothetical protein
LIATLKEVSADGVIVTVSVFVKHELTVRTNAFDATILTPLLLFIVAVTVTVYTPPADGLVQDITRDAALKVKNVVLSGVIAAVYTISLTEQ